MKQVSTRAAASQIRAGGHVVGEVRGDTFYKTVSGARHFLRQPAAIAFDVQSVKDAEAAGAGYLEVLNADNGKVYRAPMGTLWAKGFRLNRGYGEQLALALGEWNRGEVPEQLPLVFA
jgi:hypothetical protein